MQIAELKVLVISLVQFKTIERRLQGRRGDQIISIGVYLF